MKTLARKKGKVNRSLHSRRSKKKAKKALSKPKIAAKKAKKKPAKKKTQAEKRAERDGHRRTARKAVKKTTRLPIPTAKPAKKKKTKANSGIDRPKKAVRRKASTRAEAAKRGWRKRKAKARKKRVLIKKTIKRQRELHPELIGIEKDYAKKLKQAVKEAEKRGRSAGMQEAMEKMETTVSQYFEVYKGFIESTDSIIIGRLMLAADFGELDREVEDIAEEYDMEISEVYDMWFSPEA